jgi:predicted RNA-binding Zn-ribbon protein involved in translation (DUF1610 family)
MDGRNVMQLAEKLVCPECGVEMNRHALKVDYGAASDNPEVNDPDFDGVLEEVHACPVCGKASLRRADGAA